MPLNLSEALQQINGLIEQSPYGSRPYGLYEPIRYLMSLGGKRLRPALTLMANSLYSPDQEPCISPALATELFHNFTLMHDDLMDKAPLRRNKATVHARWNPETAILSGDAMLVLAYQRMACVPPDLLPGVMERFSRCALQVCEGQQMDMDFETGTDVTEDEYLHMIELKTAVLLGLCAELGGLIGGAPEADLLLLRSFGTHLGLGFQLMDDLLDVYGDPIKFGKQTGGDILANKKTFMLITALNHANAEQSKALAYWLSATDYKPSEKVAAVTKIYDQLNLRSVAAEKMNIYYNRAFEALQQLSADKNNSEKLAAYCRNLIERES